MVDGAYLFCSFVLSPSPSSSLTLVACMYIRPASLCGLRIRESSRNDEEAKPTNWRKLGLWLLHQSVLQVGGVRLRLQRWYGGRFLVSCHHIFTRIISLQFHRKTGEIFLLSSPSMPLMLENISWNMAYKRCSIKYTDSLTGSHRRKEGGEKQVG